VLVEELVREARFLVEENQSSEVGLLVRARSGRSYLQLAKSEGMVVVV
jgi:hypothetical protein